MKKKTIAALAAGGALLLAAVTALVDALPVFGTGTVLLPWAAVWWAIYAVSQPPLI